MSTDADTQIMLNGEPRRLIGDARLVTLVESLALKRGRIAIEINGTVAPRAAWPEILLKPGDTVEIVNFVGGG
ncbi:MAG: sulfur carrier protein ThiS [Candidatus Binataceae bacterium]|nr:sulfur carrier protein ThiS [Candidatus Binataceae bacterium]